MRLGRLAFILLAIYFVFIGGSAYYTLVFQVRFIHHILVTVLLVIWLVLRIRRNGLPQTPLNMPIIAVIAVWLVSAAMSIDQRMAFENLWFPLTHIVIFFILVDLFQRGWQRLVMESQFMLGAAIVLLSGLELASWYFGLGIIPGTQIGWVDVIGPGAWLPLRLPRLALAMNVSTLLAGYAAPLITLIAGWALTARRRDYRHVLWILASSLLIILILTFSRGGLLSILTAVGIVGVFRLLQMPRVTQQLPARVLVGAALFVGLSIVAGFVILSVTRERSDNSGDVGRLDMWRSAAEMTRDYPLTGVGPGIFGRAFRSYRDPTIVQDKLASAHNAYLNTAAETGILGMTASLWLGGTFVRAWYRNWKQTNSSNRQLRLEVALAALAGMGVHSLVDVFTISPIVLLMLLLAAYCITPTDMVYEGRREQAKGSRYKTILAVALLGIQIGYGVWLYQLDRAQSRYLSSFGNSSNPLADIQAAGELDPGLHLYLLQIAYLRGEEVLNNSEFDLQEAIALHQAALELEPTWDTGWINLAALSMRGDNADETALMYLDKARQINAHNLGSLQWAILAEILEAAPETEIVDAYVDAIKSPLVPLPLSTFWWETPMRQAAVEQYLESAPLDVQYRILTVHAAERAAQLVPLEPENAAEWWVAGEYALSVENDTEKATRSFGEAIRLDPSNGDYYVSRAQATYSHDPDAARRDLDIAELLGTVAEYPNAVRAAMATSDEERERLLANALPPRQVLQEFAAVLYGRPATFDVFPGMRGVGSGRDAMQPWYTIAEKRLAAGDFEGAMNAYRAILDYAPDEQEALNALSQSVEQTLIIKPDE
jgi:O-antigen ligase/tetratricopeptide (TPR) repeat protein